MHRHNVSLEELKKQLNRPGEKEDAQGCIEIYNWIKSTDKDGTVWSSRWQPLVDSEFRGWNKARSYKPTITGKTLLKGIRAKD